MVCTCGVEIQQSLQSRGREFFPDEDDKCFRDSFFREVALPEDRQDGLDTRTGRLPKDVIPLHPADVLVYRSTNIPPLPSHIFRLFLASCGPRFFNRTPSLAPTADVPTAAGGEPKSNCLHLPSGGPSDDTYLGRFPGPRTGRMMVNAR